MDLRRKMVAPVNQVHTHFVCHHTIDCHEVEPKIAAPTERAR